MARGGLIATGLADWLRTHGANVYAHSKVTEIDPEAGRVELETGEVLKADQVVVAAGAWVLKLFPELDGELKTYRHGARLCRTACRSESGVAAAPDP